MKNDQMRAETSRFIPDRLSYSPGPSHDQLRDYYLELGESPKTKTTMQTWRRYDRAANRNEKLRFRARGLRLPRPAYIWKVTLTAIDVPEWAREKALKDFDPQPREIWMHARRHAQKLMEEDAAAGGRPTKMRMESRRCKVCGLLLLHFQAQERRLFEKGAAKNRYLPCGPDCLQNKESRHKVTPD